MASRFELNPEFGKNVRTFEELRPIVQEAGEGILVRAIELAHEHDDSGEFADSIKGELRISETGAPYFEIWSDDPAALSKEFGTSEDHKPVRALGRAIGEFR